MRVIQYLPSGEIHGVVQYPDDVPLPASVVTDITLYLMPHEQAARETHWVNSGTVVEYTQEGKAKFASPPGLGFEWSPAQEQWIDHRALEQAQADAWERIKARREQAFATRAVSSSGIAYSITDDKANLADRIASLQAAVSLGMATTDTVIFWRDRDNLNFQLTLTDLNRLAAEMGARGQAIYERSWLLWGIILAAPNAEMVDAIDVETGWP